MSTTRSSRIGASWRRHVEDAAGSRVLLSLAEVRAARLPAYFCDHGERLYYQDDELFDLRDAGGGQHAAPPRALPRQVLADGVGIEYGWRHRADCACPACREREQGPADVTRDAVA